ncbi:UNKNOWN [Stylonychia lemnae]|uniref:Histidine acid phosphatase family protein n=1 Tax=Stylonychia lemnae TaxID=5949 RepID=A0A077ZU90_STYLE|nr:UNKNOWN [Stylonychia lemnae]|eukprot:CDW73473.1 UNKNOWN [Stylonychia lemnae]
MRQCYLLGVYMRKKYVQDEKFFSHEDLMNVQKHLIYHSTQMSRSTSSYQSFMYGFGEQIFMDDKKNIKENKYLKLNHLRSIKQKRLLSSLRIQNTIPYELEAKKMNESYEANEVMLNQIVFAIQGGNKEFPGLNKEICKYSTMKTGSLTKNRSQNTYLKDFMKDLMKKGVLQKVMAIFEFDPSQFDQLDVDLTMRKFLEITGEDERSQYADNQQVRMYQHQVSEHLLQSFDAQIIKTIAKQKNQTYDPKLDEGYLFNKYYVFAGHDQYLQMMGRLFGLQISFDLIRYAATMIFELHFDKDMFINGKCQEDFEKCFYVKIIFNEFQLFSEVGFCDYLSNRCWYKDFKHYLQEKMLSSQEFYDKCDDEFKFTGDQLFFPRIQNV